jgi:acyl-CoA synthetase (AMP-forming)/AMP-acid ligase II
LSEAVLDSIQPQQAAEAMRMLFPSRRLFCSLSHLTVKSSFPSSSLLASPLLNKSISDVLLPSLLSPSVKDKIYLIDGSSQQTKTFGSVYFDCYKFANCLRSVYGIQSKDCVAIISPNHFHYVTTLFGAALNGAILTTINHLNTATEIESQLEITGAKILISHPQCLDRVASIASHRGLPLITLGESDGHAVSLDDLLNTPLDTEPSSSGSSSTATAADFPSVSSDDTLLIPFSSGTTGKSKGVVLTHRNILSNILQCQIFDQYSVDKINPIALVPLPFYHIYGLFVAIFAPLYQHQTTVFLPSFDLLTFLALIGKYRVTRAFIVPPILLALAKHPIVAKYDLTSLKVISCGAAPLGSDVQLACAKRLNCIVKQGWGMTELSPVGTGSPSP